MNVTGYVWAKHYRRGKLLWEAEGSNIVVAAGKALIALRLDDQGSKPTHMAFGSGTAPAVDGDTVLGTELQRIVFVPAPSITLNAITYKTLFTSSGAQTASEFGIFNAATAGTLLARWLASTPAIMADTDTLDVTWILTVGG